MKAYFNEISNMIKNLRNKLAQKEFDTANLYLQLEQYEAAEVYFKNIINEFYDTDYINDALLNIALIIKIDSNTLAMEYLLDNKGSFTSVEKFNKSIDVIQD